MINPILCYECAENLGEVSDIISLATRGYYKNLLLNNSIKPEKLELCPNISKPIGFILDAFGLPNMCCRMHIIGMSDLHTIYK